MALSFDWQPLDSRRITAKSKGQAFPGQQPPFSILTFSNPVWTPPSRKCRDTNYSIGKQVLDKINDLKTQHQAGIDLSQYKKRFQQTELQGEPPSAV